jgi:ribosome-associated heat shock protein Hsp15
MPKETSSSDRVRIDKWLWAARFFKTRSLATEAVNRGQVQIKEQDIKPSREVRIGEVLIVWQARVARTIVVTGLSEQRGSAPQAQLLYRETQESQQQRKLLAERNRLAPEPAQAIAHGRPTKRDRRDLQKSWDARWSASIDGE